MTDNFPNEFDNENDLEGKSEYGNDIVAVTDDEGVEHLFEELQSFAEDNNEYVALLPLPDNDEEVIDDDGELIILRRVYEGDEIYLEPIEDEDEFMRIGGIFEDLLSDQFDFTD